MPVTSCCRGAAGALSCALLLGGLSGVGGATGVDTLRAEQARQRWSIVPVAGYSTETSAFVGTMGVYYPPASPASHGSAVPAIALASAEGQFQAILAPELYLSQDTLRCEGALVARRWPASYFARGNSAPDAERPYRAQGLLLAVAVQRRIGGSLLAGPTLRWSWEDVAWPGPRPPPTERGARGGRWWAAGLTTAWDTRDNTRDARAGTFLGAGGSLCRRWLGGNHNFAQLQLQARRFVGLAAGSTLGLAADLRLADGQVPFTELNTPDGVTQLRGIEGGRYRDSHLLSVQAELRRPLARRYGAAAFVDAAQVARRLADMRPRRFHWATGVGGRYALNPQQRLNLRLDAAWVDGGPGFVFNAREAF